MLKLANIIYNTIKMAKRLIKAETILSISSVLHKIKT